FSYSWSCTNGWSATSPNSATTTFNSPAIGGGQTSTGTATVTITDLQTGATSQANVSLTHERQIEALSLSLSPANQEVYLSGVPTASGAQTWTVVVSGGSGSYSFGWTMESGNTPDGGGSPSGNQITLGYHVPFGELRGSVWKITVTDN